MNGEWFFLIRRVRNKPSFFNEGRISSALFKDSKGVSVNKDDSRIITDIIIDEERLHCYYLGDMADEPEYCLKALVTFDRKVCDDNNILIEDDPLEENPHHAVLKRNNTVSCLTASQAKAIARASKIIKYY